MRKKLFVLPQTCIVFIYGVTEYQLSLNSNNIIQPLLRHLHNIHIDTLGSTWDTFTNYNYIITLVGITSIKV